MSTFKNRLDALDDRKAAREYLEAKEQFKGRSREELEFFAAHGFWAEDAVAELQRREFVVCGIKTVISTERIYESLRFAD